MCRSAGEVIRVLGRMRHGLKKAQKSMFQKKNEKSCNKIIDKLSCHKLYDISPGGCAPQ